jgi:Dehydrogenases with different specificities (related to short-chain alcohol dehydrogenases)
MKTMLVTGGTDGIGKGLVLHYLNKGYQIIAVGSSTAKGEALLEEAKKIGKEMNLIFLQANLSLVSENKRVVEMVTKKFQQLDALIMCAACLKPQESYRETQEGFEFTFSLYYLSRYYLSYNLEEMLNKSDNPIILNVAAPGMKGEVNWEDLQFKKNYDGQKVQFHGSRLNDLLGVHFIERDSSHKIRYILFNPMAARTNGVKQMASGNKAMRIFMDLYYKFKGKDVEEITEIIAKQINKATKSGFYAYILDKEVDQSMETFDKKKAKLLEDNTRLLLSKLI